MGSGDSKKVRAAKSRNISEITALQFRGQPTKFSGHEFKTS